MAVRRPMPKGKMGLWKRLMSWGYCATPIFCFSCSRQPASLHYAMGITGDFIYAVTYLCIQTSGSRMSYLFVNIFIMNRNWRKIRNETLWNKDFLKVFLGKVSRENEIQTKRKMKPEFLFWLVTLFFSFDRLIGDYGVPL